MESTDQAAVKSEVPPPPPPKHGRYFKRHFVLRLKLFVETLIAVIVMVTAKQTKPAAVPAPLDAKFNYSPAFIYFVAAFSVACLYSFFSCLVSRWVIRRPAYATKLLLYFTTCDVLMLGIVAAATGAAGAVAFVVQKGNSHFGWTKLCPDYDTFCTRLGTSLLFALLASVVLVSLILLSVLSLYRRIPPPALD